MLYQNKRLIKLHYTLFTDSVIFCDASGFPFLLFIRQTVTLALVTHNKSNSAFQSQWQPDPPENCHFSVKKLPKTFFSKKLTKFSFFVNFLTFKNVKFLEDKVQTWLNKDKVIDFTHRFHSLTRKSKPRTQCEINPHKQRDPKR